MFLNYSEALDDKLTAEAKNFDPLPIENSYDLKLSDVSELKDNRGFALVFNVLTPVEFSKRKIWKNVFLKNKDNDESKNNVLLGMFKDFLEKSGLNREQRVAFLSGDVTAQSIRELLAEKVYTVRLKNRVVNENVYQEIGKIVSVADGGVAF